MRLVQVKISAACTAAIECCKLAVEPTKDGRIWLIWREGLNPVSYDTV